MSERMKMVSIVLLPDSCEQKDKFSVGKPSCGSVVDLPMSERARKAPSMVEGILIGLQTSFWAPGMKDVSSPKRING